ncbi:MAG: RNA polymerase factor sigma-32 [Myxococcaceae bacterium]
MQTLADKQSEAAESSRAEERILRRYFAEVGRHRVLSVEEERELGRRYRAGDQKAGQTLVASNLRFAIKVARSYRSPGLPMSDLIQEASLGLMKGVERFDPERGIRLISFAVWWIRAQLQSYVLRNWSLVKVGTTQAQRRVFFGLGKAMREAKVQEGDGEAQTLALARLLQVDPAELAETRQRMASRDISLDAPATESSSTPRGAGLASDSPRPDELAAESEWVAQVRRAVDRALRVLDPRERFIAERRLLHDDPPTLASLAAHFGFSRERARQLELRAQAKLRAVLTPLVSAEYAS